MRLTLILSVLLLMLGCSGSAFGALFGDDQALAQIKQLTQRVETDEQRISKLETGTASQSAVLQLSTQIQSLQSDLADLRGQLEVLQHQIVTDEKRQQELYLDIDTRLRSLEQFEQSAQKAAAGQKPAAPAAPTPAETQAYEAALNQFQVGKYLTAIASFQAFLKAYPTSSLAPSAQYWIGNGYFAERSYKNAIAAQRKLVATWPTSPKAGDALLNIASSQEALGERRAARKTLESVVTKFPGTPAAASAKQRLGGGAKH